MSAAAAPLTQPALDRSARFVAGVDIGGTFIKVGIVDRDAQVVGRVELPSEADQGFAHFIVRIGDAIAAVVQQEGLAVEDLAGIGLGYPGTVYQETGIISGSPNIPGAHGSNLTRPLVERFGRAIVVGNDASVAALAECLYGVGRDYGARNLVLYTLGTGVGGGLVVNGQLVVGSHSQGAELGHMVIDPNGPQCGCGCYGCIEAFCGTAGILRRAWSKLQSGRASLLWNYICEFEKAELTPLMISEAAERGDAVALEVWSEIGFYLGLACASMVNAIDPDVIAFSGQITKAGAPLFDSIRRTVRARARLNPWPWQNIVPAKLGEDTGVLGAAAGVLQALA